MLLLTPTVFGQDYELYLDLEPSFIEEGHITIRYRVNGTTTLQLKNFYFDETRSLDNKTLLELKHFLENYKATKSNSIKTETSIVNGDTLSLSIMGFDGITVSGSLHHKDDVKTFEFWSPNSNTSNNALISHVFSITDSCFDKPRVRRYLNALKGCFYGLATKQNNDSSFREFRIVKDIYMVVDEMPEFIGGRDSLEAYLSKNIQENEVFNNSIASGKVYVQFTINETGIISDALTLKGIDTGIDHECVRIISKMPHWKPGTHYKEAVKVSYIIPLNINKKQTTTDSHTTKR